MAAIRAASSDSIVRSMKRFGLFPSFAAATLFLALAASDLQAQAIAVPPAPSGAKEEANPVAEYMKRLDKDGDGALSDEERAAAKELMMKEAPPLPPGRGPGAG